ncbi:helix-turn-helix domain-containing protein [Roseivirga sp. BDSF3-8]|uniref:helix-turn-helix domain-containing protein n=1 Tax=Roseivirga sp. BDSF3-8 TaxID=3241598 RepID=UPI003532780D
MKIHENNIRLIFGLKLRQLRLDNGLSLSDLNKKSGISISYLNEIEKGKKYPKGDKIMSLAEALGVTYDHLVSLKLNKKLAPVSELIRSNILSELPLDMFDIDTSRLLELLSNAPTKLSAFVSTLIEIGRSYDMRVETFYFSVLRSYQEMQENYFQEIEEAVESFASENKLDDEPADASQLLRILSERYDYQISDSLLQEYPMLKTVRTLTLPAQDKEADGEKQPPVLLLNNELSPYQKAFALGREAGYCYLGIKDRTYTSSWVEVDNFDQVLNNFRASYFSNALAMREGRFLEDMKTFMALDTWEPERLIDIMESYHATPEMFLHRMTNLLPKHFGMDELFFLRFHTTIGSDNYELTKELHLSGLHNPHGTVLNEHYCRRWISLTILKELEEKLKNDTYSRPLCGAQRSSYIDSKNEYLLISIARPASPTPDQTVSVSIGLRLNRQLLQQIKWINDPAIRTRKVGETCERCSAPDCKERMEAPLVLEAEARLQKRKTALKQIESDVRASVSLK